MIGPGMARSGDARSMIATSPPWCCDAPCQHQPRHAPRPRSGSAWLTPVARRPGPGYRGRVLAMVFDEVGRPLRAVEREVPAAGPGQVLLRVRACGVCRTDLHLMDGEVDVPAPPRVLGHQIVGTVDGGTQRVGVPWLGWTCGECRYCTSGRENLCPRARFTGRDIDGGMAEWTVADERYCFPLPDGPSDDPTWPRCCAPG